LHNQWAAASSNRTKRYGNGSTAGQIATQAGYGSAMLYGPGNSQPHKYSCGGHMVDVHALKAHASKCTVQTSTPTESATQTSTCGAVITTITSLQPRHGHAYGLLKNGKGLHMKTKTQTSVTPTGNACGGSSVQTPGGSTSVSGGAQTGVSGSVSGSATGLAAGSVKGSTQAGGVLGATAGHSANAQGGVLGALTTVGKGTLPFTGFPLWIVALAAFAMLATGLLLVRRGRATV
jgi:hypothetical protein